MNSNIYLVGFMATGKTSGGRILARKLNRRFLEMDEVIEAREGMPIVKIFSEKGEPYFRAAETQLLEEISRKNDLVVSCGGGVMCREENIKILKSSGIVVALDSSPEKIYARTKDETNRPLLNVPDPLKKITALLKVRAPYYAQAHFTVQTDLLDPPGVAEEVMARLPDSFVHGK
ncbi:MAG: shikimate kinase [Candidatus Omnitrophica bacterium]|nr:shikimate kinase [Candidatus Omnitrophota bacterium]